MPIFLGTDQFAWTKVAAISSTGALPGFGNRNQTLAVVTTDISLIGKEANAFSLRFFGKNTATKTNCRASVQLIGLQPPTGGGAGEILGDYLGRLIVELGAAESVGGVFSTGGPFKFAHRILVLDDATNKPPGCRISGDEPDAWAEIIFDAMGYRKIAVQLTNIDPDPDAPNPTAEIGFLWRPV